jgi:fructoselysine 6-kinase
MRQLDTQVRFAAIGDNCIDVYAALDQGAFGGNALNVAVRWALLGTASEYLGAVGSDAAGARIREALTAQGVSTAHLHTVPEKTGITWLALNAHGERLIVEEHLGSSASYAPTDHDLAAIADCAWVHCVSLARFRDTIRRLAALRRPVSYDFSTRHETVDLTGIEIAFFSLDTPHDQAARSLAEAARAGGAPIAIVTRGQWGSLGLCDDGMFAVPAVPVTPLDTCGAGDAYIAAFTHAYTQHLGVHACMSAATEAGAAACAHHGGWPQEWQALKAFGL